MTQWQPVVTVGEPEDVRVIVNGVDVSAQRGVVTDIGGWESGAPFDDKTASVRFPEIKTFEALPAWLPDGADVDVILVRPDGSRTTLWEGMFVDEEDSLSESDGGLGIECLGALYQADLFVQPEVSPPPDTYLRGGRVPGVTFDSRIRSEFIPVNQFTAFYRQSMRLQYPRTEGAIAPENVLAERPSWAQSGLGIEISPNASWEPVLTGRIQSYLALAVDSLGQWTLMKNPGRVPVLRRKLENPPATHTVHVGAPGVTHTLRRDITMAPNAIYGEGTDSGNCRWRNTRYPRLADPPGSPYVGEMTVGSTSAAWRAFEQEMAGAGWAFDENGRYDSYEEKLVRRLQRQAGLAETGIVDLTTWNVVFDNSRVTFGQSYFAPLATTPAVEPYLYNHTGATIGDNPLFRASVPRVERFENFGANVTREEAITSAEAELARERTPGYYGTVTLRSDPEASSLLEIKAGELLRLRGHRGVDRSLYISNARIDYKGRSATLTVDEKARDYPTLAAMISRQRELTDPSRRPQRTYRNAKAQEDRFPVWDCESGAGRFRRMQVQAITWAVATVPAGTGSIVRTDFTVDIPAPFAVGVFDRAISPMELQRLGSPFDDRYWDYIPEDRGLVIAFGGVGNAGGYYPGREGGEDPVTGELDPLTGRMVDNAAWYVENFLGQPTLWVAVWVESPATNVIQGRFFPAAT